MDLESFLDAADSWEGLGWAVQEQTRDLLERNFSYRGDLNENAVAEIARFADTLYSYHGIDTSDLHGAIDEYEALEEPEDDDS